MKRFIQWCNWELNNEFVASGYFCVMLGCYMITEFIYGKKQVDFMILLEMFLLNYVLSTIQKLILDVEKDYDNKTYYQRATGLCIGSFLCTVLVCHCFDWFKGRSIIAEVFMYGCMIVAYLFVWIISRCAKKYDTKQLNEQLERFKQHTQEE